MTTKELDKKIYDFINENKKYGYSAFVLLAKNGKAEIVADGNAGEITAGLISFINNSGVSNTFIDVLNLLKEEQKRSN